VQDTTSFALNFPNLEYPRAEITFEVQNNSGGAMAMSWSSNYKFGAAWSNPGVGASKYVTFRRHGQNGNEWREVSRGG
jgi:hypothetical protein